MLADGNRLHLHHGPIDLILDAKGPAESVSDAYTRAAIGFDGVLQELVGELELLRSPVSQSPTWPDGAIAKRMVSAVSGSDCFITPMAAVAGAVADHVLAVMSDVPGLTRAIVNNGGDIALVLKGTEKFRIAVAPIDPIRQHAAVVEIDAVSEVGGIATSGWAGRSHSLGIADAVTVLADTAANADALATLIANAVDVPGARQVVRIPAIELSPDSDLGERRVTTEVGALEDQQIEAALGAGVIAAERFVEQGQAISAFLLLQDQWRLVGRDFTKSQSPEQFPKPKYLKMEKN